MNISRLYFCISLLTFSIYSLSAQLIEIHFEENNSVLSHRIQIKDSFIVVIRNSNILESYSLEFKDTMCTSMCKFSIESKEHDELTKLCNQIVDDYKPKSSNSEIIPLHDRGVKANCLDIQFYIDDKWGKGIYSVPMSKPKVKILLEQIQKIKDSKSKAIPNNNEYYSKYRRYLRKETLISIDSFDAVFINDTNDNYYIVDSVKIEKLKAELKQFNDFTTTEFKCFRTEQLFTNENEKLRGDPNTIVFMNKGEYVHHYILGENILLNGILEIWETETNFKAFLSELRK